MTPEPLMALVREWPHEYGYGGRQDKFGHLKSCRRCAVEAALKAWAEQLGTKGEYEQFVREHVLGVEDESR